MVRELTEVVQHQKLRMRALAQEKAETAARLVAMNPQVQGARACVQFCYKWVEE